MAQRSALKASDDEREQVAERLRQAAAEGRLLASEFEQRLATALRARTHGELDSLVADLPGARVSKRGRPRGRSLPQPHGVGVVALVLAIPLIVAAVIAVAVVMITFLVFWAVVAMVSWKLVGRSHGVPGPWAFAGRRHRHGIHASHRKPVGGFGPWA